MRVYKVLIMSVLVLFSVALFSSDVRADSWDHKAYFTFLAPVEIPGRILPAGTYTFKVVAPSMHVAEIMNADETEVYGLFFTMTVDRPGSMELHATVEREAAMPGFEKRVIRWFSSGETVGDELVFYRYNRIASSDVP